MVEKFLIFGVKIQIRHFNSVLSIPKCIFNLTFCVPKSFLLFQTIFGIFGAKNSNIYLEIPSLILMLKNSIISFEKQNNFQFKIHCDSAGPFYEKTLMDIFPEGEFCSFLEFSSLSLYSSPIFLLKHKTHLQAIYKTYIVHLRRIVFFCGKISNKRTCLIINTKS